MTERANKFKYKGKMNEFVKKENASTSAIINGTNAKTNSNSIIKNNRFNG